MAFNESIVFREFFTFFSFATAIPTKISAVTNSRPPEIKNPVELAISKVSLTQNPIAMKRKMIPKLTMASAKMKSTEDLAMFLSASINSALANSM